MIQKKELREGQVADLAFYMMKPRRLNLSDPATGKTGSVCAYAYWLWTEKKVGSAWAMPKSLLEQNRNALLEYTDFKPKDVIIVDGTPSQRQKQLESGAKVFLMGFDSFATNWRLLPDYTNALLVDEVHLGYTGNNAKRTQSVYEAMDYFTYFLAMTGTLINGRLSCAYPMIRIIEPNLYPSYEAFLMLHSVVDSYGKIVAWTRPEPIAAFFKRNAIRHTFEEIYGKEAKVIVNEQCQMDPAQRKAYDEFADTALLELEESWLEGTLPGVHLIRCRQLMEHPQTFGAPLDSIKLTGKEEKLLVHLANDKPLIIFAALVPSQERIVEICRRAGKRVGLINGNVSMNGRNEVDEAFRAGELDVVVASPATAGIGFNWDHVDTVIFMSLDYMDSSFLQGYRRAMRGVRKTPLLIYVMEYENSVDQRIFKIVETKSAMANDVDDTNPIVKLSGDQVKPPKGVRILPADRKMKMSDRSAVHSG